MSESAPRRDITLGFLTVAEHPEQGVFGGYLIVNANGRPLEFHCTAPIKTSRAQEILYGATLKPFILGEQIGRALIRKGRVHPLVVCTDMRSILSAREFVDVPMVQVMNGAEAAVPSADLVTFTLGHVAVAVPTAYAADRDVLLAAWTTLANAPDLGEPLERIRGAIEEARKAAAA